MALFWDRSNWQPMNIACNTRKAIRSEGGFGRPLPTSHGQSGLSKIGDTPGRVKTLADGVETAGGGTRDISPNSDRRNKSR